ncbi:MAG: 30S ribosomal protein S12 methylthiotransferase RimO [Kibdelosporangium sp.]
MFTLGCARNEVDSEELAGRLVGSGWELAEADAAEVIVVNTCGFVEQAKKDSVDTLLAAADTGAKVVAVGCMAERYGKELADSMPEAAAVLGFDEYPELGDRLDEVLHGKTVESHVPVDRRTLLPISPVKRQESELAVPGHGWGPRVLRTRLDDSPVAALKIASGCDRRCTFCAIPSFRGAFVSRGPDEIVAEAAWLAENGVRELFLVSENSTSYGKDLAREHGGGPEALEKLLRKLAAVPGIKRVRVSYLQPAETRPGLVRTISATPGVADYFDLSFQHGSNAVLRRMRRFGGCDDFLALIGQIRELAPNAGIRTNVIVGFPGETEADLRELERFLVGGRLDAVGVFGYSDEDGTEAAGFAETEKHDTDTVTERVSRISALVEQLTTQRAEDRIGDEVIVMIEQVADDEIVGRAAHQAPEVDGECLVEGDLDLAAGDFVRCVVEDTEGVDLLVRAVEVLP